MNSKTLTMKLGNGNDDRAWPGAILPKFGFDARISNQMADVNILGINEIAARNLDLAVNMMKERGYAVETMSYSPNQIPDGSFYHVIGIKDVKILETVRFWFTSTPRTPLTPDTRKTDPVLKEYNEQFEKGCLCLVIEHNGRPIIVAFNHFGLKRFGTTLQYTNKCSELLADLFSQLREKYPGADIVAGADFNAFDGTTHVESLCELTPGLNNRTPAGCTFINYPWDFGLITPDNRKFIEETRAEMAGMTPGEYIQRSKEVNIQLRGGLIKSSIDRILTTLDPTDCKITLSHNFDDITVDDYAEEPFAPSDHVAFIFEIV